MRQEALDLYGKLTAEWNKKPQNLEKCTEILSHLKLILTEMGFIPAQGSKIDKKELHLARDVLEIGAQCSIATGDIPAFERYISQLKTFYFDFQNDISESPYKYQLIGLNLLCLLARNRLAEFHTELELLNPKIIQSNIYIRHPVSLEQYLMEEEIASCMEAAYKRILFSEAGNMLYFKNHEELVDFAKERKWNLASDKFFYFQQKGTIEQENQTIPANELVLQMVDYAKELEIIV